MKYYFVGFTCNYDGKQSSGNDYFQTNEKIIDISLLEASIEEGNPNIKDVVVLGLTPMSEEAFLFNVSKRRALFDNADEVLKKQNPKKTTKKKSK